MKAIEFAAPRTAQLIDVAEPSAPGPGQALVRSHSMGVCGTDVSAFFGRFPFFDFPRIPGHELGVEVLAVGPGVEAVAAGDRCAVEPYLNCGSCYACRRGATNCCPQLSVIGVMENGGLCERFVIRADKLHPSPSRSFEQLALVETLGIGCHAIGRAQPVAGERLLIVGVGPIGLAALEFARLAEADVTVVDTQATRLAFCEENYGIANCIDASAAGGAEGVEEQLSDLSNGDMYRTVIDATGSSKAMAASIGYVASTGTLVFLGLTRDEISFPQPIMHKAEIQIMASRNALPDDFRRIIRLIDEGAIDTDTWISHRTSFAEVPETFESFTRPETGVVKAMIDVAGV